MQSFPGLIPLTDKGAKSSPKRLNASELIELVLDPGSFISWDHAFADPVGALHKYVAELNEARSISGVDEAVLTGEGYLKGRRVAIVVGEFGFLGGSIGVSAATRIVDAFERATREHLPLLAAPVSGGTRMQEGTLAFMQMVGITAAVVAHKSAGLPYLVYLRHPTTGGVLASWGSLGHVTVAEPGALIGFLGPRVYEALHGEPFPKGVQTSENLFAHGLVDAVLAPERLAELTYRALTVLAPDRSTFRSVANLEKEPLGEHTAWESILLTRASNRPGIRSLLLYGANNVLPLHGTGEGEAQPSMLLALARFGSAPCILLAQDRVNSDRPLGPAGLREARRGMKLAAELKIPLVTVIDTPGAALSKESEEGGLAGEIARSLADQISLDAPTLCLLLGQGGGGGALAILPADRVIAAEHGWLSPLPPEGASVIVHRTTEFAAQMATEQGVRARDLLAVGIVDRIVAERPDAAREPEEFAKRLSQLLEHELISLMELDPVARLAKRLAKYRSLGRNETV
jgi:acetyl-CoA carboxylase beta subunit/acetyl-CoA carboxylase alpha subunit